MARSLALSGNQQLIHVRAEPAARHQRGVEGAHRAGRRVPRVGEGRLVGILPLTVDALERTPRQVDLAADLDRPWRAAVEPQRKRADDADVRGHVLASHAVSAGDATRQHAIDVRQRDAQAVDLQLGDVVDRRVPAACSLSDSLVERAELVFAVGVVEAEHRLKVLGGLEAFDRATADALRRRVRRHQIRVLRLQRLELLHQRIEGFVGDFRIVLDVVAVFVTTDLVAELGDACDRVHRARAAPAARRRHRTGQWKAREQLTSIPAVATTSTGVRNREPAAEEDELHATERCAARVVAQNGDHQTRAVRYRKAADACAEGRERETLKALGGRYVERRTRR